MINRLAVALLSFTSIASAADTVSTKTVLSDVYSIEKKYLSMEGPSSTQVVFLGEPSSPELIWLTAVRTEVVGEDGKTSMSPALMCHMNVDIDTAQHRALFNVNRNVQPRLITLSQGMMTKPGVFEARVPEGFGFPLSSSEPLMVATQVLNHNIPKPKNLRVRHRVTFEYYRDRDLTTPLKPLFNLAAAGMVLLKDPLAMPPPSEMAASDAGEHGASCLVMARAPNATGMSSDYMDPTGRRLTGHWVVPPGKQVNHSDVTWFMDLPYDVTIHYTAVHLHPFARKLTLRDLTTGETLYEANASNPKKGVGLSHVDSYASSEGVRLHKNHQYEMVSVYDNPTRKNADSMAVMFFGAADPEFVKPDPQMLMLRTLDLSDRTLPSLAVIRTNAGDFGIELLPNQAPQAVKRFIRMARSGAYDHSKAVIANPDDAVQWTLAPMSDLQRAFATPLVVEPSKHNNGSLSMCPGDDGFAIVIGSPAERDGHCTAFARIGPGGEVLRAIVDSPRDAEGQSAVEMTKIELLNDPSQTAGLKLDPPKPAGRM